MPDPAGEQRENLMTGRLFSRRAALSAARVKHFETPSTPL